MPIASVAAADHQQRSCARPCTVETFDTVLVPPHEDVSPAQNIDPRAGQRESSSEEHDALDSELFGAGVVVLSRRFAAARITTWPDGSSTVLRTVAEQREAAAVLSEAPWVVPVTANGYLLPSV
jgi:hypothetical protein